MYLDMGFRDPRFDRLRIEIMRTTDRAVSGRIFSGVHKGGFSKEGFSHLCVIIIIIASAKPPFTKPFANSRSLWHSAPAYQSVNYYQ